MQLFLEDANIGALSERGVCLQNNFIVTSLILSCSAKPKPPYASFCVCPNGLGMGGGGGGLSNFIPQQY